MFVLTKRTAPSDRGNIMHSIHGYSEDVSVARAWFRATRTTDVVELVGVESVDNFRDDCEGSVISEKRVPSWREEQMTHEKAIAGIGGCARA